MSNKLLVVGPGRCGKDTCGAFLDLHLGLRYCCSTSWAALPIMTRALGRSDQIVWEERHQNRQLWKDVLDEARKLRPALLIEMALARDPHGRVVTGVRDRAEILAAKEKNLFKHYLWLDRPGIPPDATVTFTAADCTDFVLNDGSLRRLYRNLVRWAVSVNLDGVQLSTYATELLLDATP